MPKPPTSSASHAVEAAAAGAAATTTIDPHVLQDLAAALLEESDYHDTYLIASDGVHVAACRFILAARSSVLKKMLYGNFREAQASTICMVGYDSRTLQAVVDYCCTNALHLASTRTTNNGNNDKSRSSSSSSSRRMEQLVQVYNAADFLDLHGLATLAEREIRKTMSACPSLACLVLNLAATSDSPVSQYALQMIEVRPYVALDSSNSNSNSSNSNSSRGANTCVGGGVECLQPEWLLYVMKSQSIAAGEFFLFYMLNRWYEHHVKRSNNKAASSSNQNKQKASSSSSSSSGSACASSFSPLDVAYQCAKYIQFDNIEPQILLDDALQKKCPWMSPTWIFDAIAKQALRASHDRIWSVQCRGGGGNGGYGGSSGAGIASSSSSNSASASCMKSRILVEGAGHPNANGIYYLSISGLTRGGDLYSKREISVGQEYVYTLSCRLAPTDQKNEGNGTSNSGGAASTMDASGSTTSATMVECRIFCSKLLSHAAISTLHDIQQFNRIRGHLDPVFQPILQILSVEAPSSPSLTRASTNHPTPLHDTFHRLQVSDGDWAMPATLASTPHLRELIQRGDLVENSIIQVLDFGLYLTDRSDNSGSNSINSSCCCLHIQRISIVNANPGQEFGTPRPFVYQGAVGNNSNNNNETTTGSGHSSVASGSYGERVLGTGGIQNLYTCTYPLDRQAKDTKIPRTGWLVAEHGQGPSPGCTWIPGVIRSDTVASAPAVSAAGSSSSSSSSSSGPSVATAPTSNIAENSVSLANMGLSTRR
jgi:BTB/POZ domain